ncbi:MAG: HRDC domain-containing protein, partial [Deinococcus sp.]|nr:HRDC domain-containing protein [Deinococcus sp.]
ETPARPLTPAPQPDGAEVPAFPVTAQATADATPLGHEPQADRGEGSAVQTPESAPAPESTQDSAASPQPGERGANRSEHRNDDRGRRDQRGRPGRGRERGPAEHAAEPLELEPAAALQPDLPVPAAQPGSGKPDPTADLTDEQSAVFARLRDWRNAEASRQEISRFIVASNATLAEIARRVPYTVEDLQTIKGMGPARLSKYGEAIVQVVRGTRS